MITEGNYNLLFTFDKLLILGINVNNILIKDNSR